MGKYLGEEMKVLCAPGVSPDAKVTARRVARSIAAALLVVPVAAAYLGANASASGLSTTSGKTVSKRPTGALKLPASKLKTVGKTKCGQVKSLWLAGEPLKGGYFISFDQQSKNYSALAKKVKKNQHKKRADYLKQSKSFASKAKAGRTACNKKAPTPITPVPTPKGPTSALKGALGVGVSSSANATRLLERRQRTPIFLRSYPMVLSRTHLASGRRALAPLTSTRSSSVPTMLCISSLFRANT